MVFVYAVVTIFSGLAVNNFLFFIVFYFLLRKEKEKQDDGYPKSQ
jgi:hypothetical protein